MARRRRDSSLPSWSLLMSLWCTSSFCSPRKWADTAYARAAPGAEHAHECVVRADTGAGARGCVQQRQGHKQAAPPTTTATQHTHSNACGRSEDPAHPTTPTLTRVEGVGGELVVALDGLQQVELHPALDGDLLVVVRAVRLAGEPRVAHAARPGAGRGRGWGGVCVCWVGGGCCVRQGGLARRGREGWLRGAAEGRAAAAPTNTHMPTYQYLPRHWRPHPSGARALPTLPGHQSPCPPAPASSPPATHLPRIRPHRLNCWLMLSALARSSR